MSTPSHPAPPADASEAAAEGIDPCDIHYKRVLSFQTSDGLTHLVLACTLGGETDGPVRRDDEFRKIVIGRVDPAQQRLEDDLVYAIHRGAEPLEPREATSLHELLEVRNLGNGNGVVLATRALPGRAFPDWPSYVRAARETPDTCHAVVFAAEPVPEDMSARDLHWGEAPGAFTAVQLAETARHLADLRKGRAPMVRYASTLTVGEIPQLRRRASRSRPARFTLADCPPDCEAAVLWLLDSDKRALPKPSFRFDGDQAVLDLGNTPDGKVSFGVHVVFRGPVEAAPAVVWRRARGVPDMNTFRLVDGPTLEAAVRRVLEVSLLHSQSFMLGAFGALPGSPTIRGRRSPALPLDVLTRLLVVILDKDALFDKLDLLGFYDAQESLERLIEARTRARADVAALVGDEAAVHRANVLWWKAPVAGLAGSAVGRPGPGTRGWVPARELTQSVAGRP